MGLLAMRPDEFWRSTPREISDLIRGARWRERRRWERTAWLAMQVMSPHTGRRTPGMKKLLSFLGPESRDGDMGTLRKDAATPEEARAIIEALAREHKTKAWTMLKDDFAPPEKQDKDGETKP